MYSGWEMYIGATTMEDCMEVFLKLKFELPPILKQTYIFAQSKALKQSHAIIRSFSKHFWGVFTEKIHTT